MAEKTENPTANNSLLNSSIKLEKWCPIFTRDQNMYVVGFIGENSTTSNEISGIFTQEKRLFVQCTNSLYELIDQPQHYSQQEIDSPEIILLDRDQLENFWCNFDHNDPITCFDGVMDEVVGPNSKNCTENQSENPSELQKHVDASTIPATEANNSNDNVTSWLRNIPNASAEKMSNATENAPDQSSFVVMKRLSQATEKSYAAPVILPPASFIDTPVNQNLKNFENGETDKIHEIDPKDGTISKKHESRKIPQTMIYQQIPEMKRWEQEAEEIINWSIDMLSNKTIRIVCIKKGKTWATTPVVEVLYSKLPYCYFRTAKRTYKLTGPINIDLCRPKACRACIGVAFIDGFPSYWSNVRDIIISIKAKAEEEVVETGKQREKVAKSSKKSNEKSSKKTSESSGHGKETDDGSKEVPIPAAPEVFQAPPPPASTIPANPVPEPAQNRNLNLELQPKILDIPLENNQIKEKPRRKFAKLLERIQETATPTLKSKSAKINPNVPSPENAKRIFSSTPHVNRMNKLKPSLRELSERVLSPIPMNPRLEPVGIEMNMDISAIERPDAGSERAEFLSPQAKDYVENKEEDSTEEGELVPPKSLQKNGAKNKSMNVSFKPVLTSVTSPTKRKTQPSISSSPAPELRPRNKPQNHVLPKRPVRKRPKQKDQTHFDDQLHAPIGNAESDSEKDSEPPSRSKKKQPAEKVKQTEKSKQKLKPVVKKSTKSKSSKDDTKEAESVEKITANKNSKKYRGQQKAHLITNQKAVDVDISNSSSIEKDDILNGEADETVLGFDLNNIKPSQNRDGAATPSFFQTPNQSGAESQATSTIGINHNNNSSDEKDQENTQENRNNRIAQLNNVVTHKLSKKTNSKKKTVKKKNPKFTGENSVLTDKNQRLLIQKLEKASKQNKGGRKKFVSSSSDDDDSSDVGESQEGESFTV